MDVFGKMFTKTKQNTSTSMLSCQPKETQNLKYFGQKIKCFCPISLSSSLFFGPILFLLRTYFYLPNLFFSGRKNDKIKGAI